MSEIWTMDCPTCGGSASVPVSFNPNPNNTDHWTLCPDCHDGKLRLEVECENCEGQGGVMVMRRGQYVTRDMAMDCGMPEIAGAYMGDEPEPEPCEPCEATGYLPMLEKELEEMMIVQYPNISINEMISRVSKGEYFTYKGQRVRVK